MVHRNPLFINDASLSQSLATFEPQGHDMEYDTQERINKYDEGRSNHFSNFEKGSQLAYRSSTLVKHPSEALTPARDGHYLGVPDQHYNQRQLLKSKSHHDLTAVHHVDSHRIFATGAKNYTAEEHMEIIHPSNDLSLVLRNNDNPNWPAVRNGFSLDSQTRHRSNWTPGFHTTHQLSSTASRFDDDNNIKSRSIDPGEAWDSYRYLSKQKILTAIFIMFCLWSCVILLKAAILVSSVNILPWIVGTNAQNPGGLVGGLWGFCVTGHKEANSPAIEGYFHTMNLENLPICVTFASAPQNSSLGKSIRGRLLTDVLTKYADTSEMRINRAVKLFELDQFEGGESDSSVKRGDISQTFTYSKRLNNLNHELGDSLVDRVSLSTSFETYKASSSSIWPWVRSFFDYIPWPLKLLKQEYQLKHVQTIRQQLKYKLAGYLWAFSILISNFIYALSSLTYISIFYIMPKISRLHQPCQDKISTRQYKSTIDLTSGFQSQTIKSRLSHGKFEDKKALLRLEYLQNNCCRSTLCMTGYTGYFSSALALASCLTYSLGWNDALFQKACGRQTNIYNLDGCRLGTGYYLALFACMLEFSIASFNLILARKITVYQPAIKFRLSRKYIGNKSLWTVSNTISKNLTVFDGRKHGSGDESLKQPKDRYNPIKNPRNLGRLSKAQNIQRLNLKNDQCTSGKILNRSDVSDGMEDRSIYSYLPTSIRNRHISEL